MKPSGTTSCAQAGGVHEEPNDSRCKELNIMNVLAVLIVGGPLMALAGLPAVADHPAPLLASGPLLKLADDQDFAARKQAYLEKTHNEMAGWRKKMNTAGERTETEAHEVSADTKAHLDRTWAATERTWRKLQAERAEGWDRTKTAYEQSTAELRTQWHKVHPEDAD
jgi:hypothetical protein